MKASVTIIDVARQAKVSPTTVSRIINDRADVSIETRAHVKRVMEELGYVPRVQAQSLASGRSKTVALLFPLEDAQASQLELSFVLGAARAAEDVGFYFNLLTNPTTESSLEQLIRSAQFDGALIMNVTMDDWRIRRLADAEFDFVMIGRTREPKELSYVDFDFEEAAVRMLHYLHGLGHREIGFITRPQGTRLEGLGPNVRLYNGFLRVTEELGLQRHVRETNRTPDDASAAFASLLTEAPKVTAIVTTHGYSTVGVLREATARDLSIPQDLSVLTIATPKIARTLSPALTAVDFPSYDMGYEAARILVERISGTSDQSPRQKLFAPDICIRNSVAEPSTDSAGH